MWQFLYKLASPQSFYRLAGQFLRYLKPLSLLLFVCGLIGGLILAPADYQQGDAFRIIYIHVPSAFMSLGVYSFMAFCAVISLVWRIKLADIMIKVSAPLGAWFTFLALVTGSIWGRPMWGTWWIWDARLTSELILLFIYLAIIALQAAIPDRVRAARAVSFFVLIGFVDIPLIHFSVDWWNTLHQGASLSLLSKPTIVPSMLMPLLAMIFAFLSYFILLTLIRARTEVLHREQHSLWVQHTRLDGKTF